MAKPVIKFKTYRQAAAVGGKIYGVPNLGDPVVAEVTMQEVIDYAKLHNYSADTLSALLSQVIAGVGDLVARDGRPRMLSDLLKFEPVIKGTFSNMEQTVTNQKVLVRPRMLKEIKVALDPSNYAWQNQNDTESPRIYSVAPVSDIYSDISIASMTAALAASNGFGFTYAGIRLCPNGWDSSCSFRVLFRPKTPLVVAEGATVSEVHIERNASRVAGFLVRDTTAESTDNSFALAYSNSGTGEPVAFGWYDADSEGEPGNIVVAPQFHSGDVFVFEFTRTTASGDTFTVEKSYTL